MRFYCLKRVTKSHCLASNDFVFDLIDKRRESFIGVTN
jgi:hypothetical protein